MVSVALSLVRCCHRTGALLATTLPCDARTFLPRIASEAIARIQANNKKPKFYTIFFIRFQALRTDFIDTQNEFAYFYSAGDFQPVPPP